MHQMSAKLRQNIKPVHEHYLNSLLWYVTDICKTPVLYAISTSNPNAMHS